MNSVEFGKQYLESFEGVSSPIENLTTALALRTLGVHEEQYESVVASYSNNAANNVLESAIRMNGSDVRYLRGEYIPRHEGGLGNPGFYHLTFAMRSIWSAIHQSALNRDTIKPTEQKVMNWAYADLRGLGADLLWRRDRLIRKNYEGVIRSYACDRDEDTSNARANTEGLLNEFDAALILGAIAMEQKLCVLPAPPMFESTKGINSDFLLIDPSSNEVAGVQVKLKAKNDPKMIESYEREGVVTISGMHDLENFRTHYSKDTGKNLTYPYAGLVVSMCNKYYDWKSPQADTAVSRDKHFNSFIIANRAKKQTIAQKHRLYDNYARIVDHVWTKVQPVLRSM